MKSLFHTIKSFLFKEAKTISSGEKEPENTDFAKIEFTGGSQNNLVKSELLQSWLKKIQEGYSFYSYLSKEDKQLFMNSLRTFVLNTEFRTSPGHTLTQSQIFTICIDITRVWYKLDAQEQDKIISVMLYPRESIFPASSEDSGETRDLKLINGYTEKCEHEVVINIIKEYIQNNRNYYTKLKKSLSHIDIRLKVFTKIVKKLEVLDRVLQDLEPLLIKIEINSVLLLRAASKFDTYFLGLHRALALLNINFKEKEKEEFDSFIQIVSSHSHVKFLSIEKLINGYFMHVAWPSVILSTENKLNAHLVIHLMGQIIYDQKVSTMMARIDRMETSEPSTLTDQQTSNLVAKEDNLKELNQILDDSVIFDKTIFSDENKIWSEVLSVYNDDVLHKNKISKLLEKSHAQYALTNILRYFSCTSEAYFNCPALFKEIYPALSLSYYDIYYQGPKTDTYTWADATEERLSFLRKHFEDTGKAYE